MFILNKCCCCCSDTATQNDNNNSQLLAETAELELSYSAAAALRVSLLRFSYSASLGIARLT